MKHAVKLLMILVVLIEALILISSIFSRTACSYYGFQTDREVSYAAFVGCMVKVDGVWFAHNRVSLDGSLMPLLTRWHWEIHQSKEKWNMLILTRRVGESMNIGNDIKITVLGVKGLQVRIGIDAPKDVEVHREEIAQRIKAGMAKPQTV